MPLLVFSVLHVIEALYLTDFRVNEVAFLFRMIPFSDIDSDKKFNDK